MKDKKLQVFVSSTYIDLIEERQAAVAAILSTGNIPAGMELFSAGNQSQMTVIKRWIDESDVYLLILGGRYGSLDKKTGKSYTQLEFEYAIEKKKPFFSVVISESGLDEKVKAMGRSALEDSSNKELAEFRSQVLSKLVKFWDDTKDIKIAIHETLSEFKYSPDLIGWVRPENSMNTNTLIDEISRLTNENKELREKVSINNNEKLGDISFHQMKKLLKNEKVEYQGNETDLFSFLVIEGNNIAGYGQTIRFQNKDIEPYQRLEVFKVVDDIGGSESYRYKLTEGGHKFYLKLLLDKVDETN